MDLALELRPDDVPRLPLYAVDDGALVGPAGAALADLSLSLPDGAVTVLLGAAGTGKSLLLRALAGRPLPKGWKRQGSWRRRGRDLAGEPGGDILWLPQVRRRDYLDFVEREELVRAVLGLVRWEQRACLLLDDPTGESIMAPLPRILRSCVDEGGGAVLATDDLRLAREVADYAVLLGTGGVLAQGAAPAFFDDPPHELARLLAASRRG